MLKSKTYESKIIREKSFLTVKEVVQGMSKLRERIAQVEVLKKEGNPYWDAQRVSAQFSIRRTIREVFGEQSPEYREHRNLRLRAHTEAEIAETISILNELITILEEKKPELERGPAKPVPKLMASPNSSPAAAPHPAPSTAQSGAAHVSATPLAAGAPPPPAKPASVSPPTAAVSVPAPPPKTTPAPASMSLDSAPPSAAPSAVKAGPASPVIPTSSAAAIDPSQPATTSSATDPLGFLRKISARFHAVARHLRRREDRPTLEVEDEHDVQDVLRVLLCLECDDIITETWRPPQAGATERRDLVLPQHRIVIQVKKTRPGLGAKEITKQVAADVEHYSTHPKCKTLFCFVYDPEGRIGDPRGLEASLSGASHGMRVEVQVSPK